MKRLFNAPGQLGHVVADIHTAMQHWVSTLDAGPFYTFSEPVRRPAIFRGQRVDVSFLMAFTYFGETQLEFIQPLDRTPSPYTEFLAAGGEGFHHILYWVEPEDYDTVVQRLHGSGFKTIFSVTPDAPHPPIYLEAPKPFGLLTEIAIADPVRHRAYAEMRRAAQDWDGSDPVRIFKSREEFAASLIATDGSRV
jgi:hypothetical protein